MEATRVGFDLDSWNAQLRKGVVQILILQVLAPEPLYGYAIVRRLEELGDFVAGEGTVYPVLRRLEAGGLLSSAWRSEASGNPRKYYSLTEDGKRFLGSAIQEWGRIDGAIRGLGGGSDELD
jgi:PadR family transcriptional regulator PadR